MTEATPDPLALDDINRRLGEIDHLLDTEAKEPSPQQFALLTERDHLRKLASEHWPGVDTGRTTAELISEKKALELRLRSQITARTGFVTSKGGSNQGPTAGAWVELGASARRSGKFDRIRARLSAIEAELSKRNSAT